MFRNDHNEYHWSCCKRRWASITSNWRGHVNPLPKNLSLVLLWVLAFPNLFFASENQQEYLPTMGTSEALAQSVTEQPLVYVSMPAPGNKVWIHSDYYIIYGFDKKPKLGTIIMKVEVYTRAGKRDTSLEIMADSGMPSMKGAHETGDQPFRLSKKGDYLLPVNIVMPGDWEIRLTFLKDGKVQYRGSYPFDV